MIKYIMEKIKHLAVEERVHKKVRLASIMEGKTISELIDDYFSEYDKLIVED